MLSLLSEAPISPLRSVENRAICERTSEAKVSTSGRRAAVIYSRRAFSAVCFDQLLMHYSPSAARSWLSPFQYVAKVRAFIKHAAHKSGAKVGLPDVWSPGGLGWWMARPLRRTESPNVCWTRLIMTEDRVTRWCWLTAQDKHAVRWESTGAAIFNFLFSMVGPSRHLGMDVSYNLDTVSFMQTLKLIWVKPAGLTSTWL